MNMVHCVPRTVTSLTLSFTIYHIDTVPQPIMGIMDWKEIDHHLARNVLALRNLTIQCYMIPTDRNRHSAERDQVYANFEKLEGRNVTINVK